jgi:hypothetical protein|tara:strand:- start:203 stop:709 length:507 start_codon:yes stop_codon:yes gene_type:complete
MVRVTGTGKFTKAVSKKLHVAEDEVEDEADSDKEKEEAKEEVVDDVKENADDAGGSDGDEEADDKDDENDDDDEDDEDEEDGLGDSEEEEEEEEEEEGAVKKGKSRKRNQFIDDAAEVRPLPEPMRVIAFVTVCFTRRVHIIAAQTAREDLRTSEIGPCLPIAFSRIF